MADDRGQRQRFDPIAGRVTLGRDDPRSPQLPPARPRRVAECGNCDSGGSSRERGEREHAGRPRGGLPLAVVLTLVLRTSLCVAAFFVGVLASTVISDAATSPAAPSRLACGIEGSTVKTLQDRPVLKAVRNTTVAPCPPSADGTIAARGRGVRPPPWLADLIG
jgi:hypothetical protein